MAYIKLPSTLSWSNIYTLSGVTSGKSLVVTNYWTQSITIIESASTPSANATGYPVLPGMSVSLSYKGTAFWVKGEDGYISVDEINKQSIEPYVGGVDLPNDVWTSRKDYFRRLRVDVGQTGFFEGREFRTFKEFSISAGATYTLRIVVPIDVILFQQALEIDAGSLRITNASGGTPGGTFSETLPVIGKNNMSFRPSPFYTPQVVFTAGGTHTGGFVFDIHRAVAANATAQQATVGHGQTNEERGVAANTYYVKYENIGSGTATGTFWFIWEEYPSFGDS